MAAHRRGGGLRIAGLQRAVDGLVLAHGRWTGEPDEQAKASGSS